MTARYLADKSALARTHCTPVRDVIGPLLVRGALATCALIDLEMLFSARSLRDYDETLARRRANYPRLAITETVCDRVIEVQGALAVRGQHRAASIPDLLVAACAEVNGVTVLHYDADYDLIASITGQSAQWVVPCGSVP